MDNLAYADDYAAKLRTELIDGKIVMMSPRARIRHNTIITNIVSEFRHYLKGKKCRAFCDGVDVFLDDKNRFIPDVMIVCNADIIKDDGIHGAPDLVVEVLSPSTAKNDKGKKFVAYEQAGVKEYWIVSPLGRTVEVYLQRHGKFELDDVYTYFDDEAKARNATYPEDNRDIIQEDIKVSLYDDLAVKLKDIFE